MSDFCPISLVTLLYKVTSKVLAERIILILPSTVDNSQMTFVEGWQIMDAILMAVEAVDDYRVRKKRGFVIKVNFEKAYDKVD